MVSELHALPFRKRWLRSYPSSVVHLRGLVAFSLLLDQLSFGVDSKDPAVRNPNLLVGIGILQDSAVIQLTSASVQTLQYTGVTMYKKTVWL